MKKILFIVIFLVGLNAHAQVFQSFNMNLLSQWNDTTVVAEPSYGIKYNGIWGYEANGHEYGLIGSTAGVYFIDITNPQNPVVSDFVAGRRAACIWREIKTYSHYAYLISDDQSPNSFQIVDLQYLPDSVHVVADYSSLFERGHTLFVDGNKLYVGIARGGQFSTNASMAVFSLNNPVAPVYLRSINDDFPTLLAGNQVHDMFVKNDTIYASCGYDGLYIFKFDSLSNHIQLINSLTSYPSQGYNHSSALADNGALVFTDEVPTGLPVKIVDASDLQNLTVTSSFSSNSGVTPHNPFIKNNMCYMAYYLDGLFVYDVSDMYNPVLTAYFDTHYQDALGGPYPSLGYQGAWGAYPFFLSGNIIVSDMQNGMFVLNQASSVVLNNEIKGRLSVYPNPVKSNDNITISNINNEKLIKIVLMNSIGDLILDNELPVINHKATISLMGVNPGLYFLNLKVGSESFIEKIIVN
ncbi:MAG: choice-of-anchor B family protein [Bacteroidota bacterium]